MPTGVMETASETANRPLVDVRDLSVRFVSRDVDVSVVNGVSFELHQGQVLCLLGESGSGKSVTMRALMRLFPPTARIGGQISIDGNDILELSDNALRKVRGRVVSMAFQEPMTAFDPVFAIGAQIVESVRYHDGTSAADARKRALELLELVQVPSAKRRLDAYPHELSGGLRQRAMIALALACWPKLIVLNKPGAATLVGTTDAAKAAPDGLTMLFAANTNLINNIALFDKLPYDPINDFSPVAKLVALPLMIAANPKAPFKTLPELVEYARKNPDKVTRASAGVANITNIGLLHFESLQNIKMWHVPYAGDAAAMQALIAGDVDIYTTTVALMRQHVLDGRVRGLAILGREAVRDSEVPNVPTATEVGFPEFDMDSWYAVVVPAKTQRAVIDQLNSAANAALKDP